MNKYEVKQVVKSIDFEEHSKVHKGKITSQETKNKISASLKQYNKKKAGK